MSQLKPSILILPSWNDPRMIAGIVRYAMEHNWHLALQYLMTRELPVNWVGDGAILGEGGNASYNSQLNVIATHTPTVTLGDNGFDVPCPTLHLENSSMGKMAARYFLEKGHLNFAWYASRTDFVAAERGEAFRAELATHGHLCSMLNYPESAGNRYALRSAWLMKQLGDLKKPLAVFALDDLHAVEVIEASLHAGYRVPEDIAVMGVGNTALAFECSQVPITSIDYDMEYLGYLAAEVLDLHMQGKDTSDVNKVVPPSRIVSRKSTNTFAITDARLLRAIRFMYRNLSIDVSVEDVAKAVDVPYRTLQDLFNKHLYRSPAKFFLQLRLDQACEMLLGTDQPILTIAKSCGFKSARNINRCFNREIGISPQVFRKTRSELVAMTPAFEW